MSKTWLPRCCSVVAVRGNVEVKVRQVYVRRRTKRTPQKRENAVRDRDRLDAVIEFICSTQAILQDKPSALRNAPYQLAGFPPARRPRVHKIRHLARWVVCVIIPPPTSKVIIHFRHD